MSGQNGKGKGPEKGRNIKNWNERYDSIDFSPTNTSDVWLAERYPKLTVVDPDGWDRTDFEFSFYKERINLQEFERRLAQSTVIQNKS